MAGSFFDDPDQGIEEEEQPVNVQKAPLPLRIIGNVFKYAFWLFILTINVVIFWRLFSTGIPSSMKTVSADPSVKYAYSQWKDNTDEDKQPFAVYQKLWLKRGMTTETKDENRGIIGNYGYFGIVDEVFFPDAQQFQFVFRYNFSTLEHVKEDMNLSSDLDRGKDHFDVWIRVETFRDETKDAENVNTAFYPCETVDSAKKNLYCYRQMKCDYYQDLDNISAVYADIFYKDEAQYVTEGENAVPYGSICVYSSDHKLDEYKLDRKDIKALNGE